MGRITLEDPRDFLFWRQGSGQTVEIYDLQVGSKRRDGKGRRLVNHLIDQKLPPGTNLVWAITRSSNFVAQQFYESMRFRVVAVLRNFYAVKDEDGHENVDAIMYGRDIGSKA